MTDSVTSHRPRCHCGVYVDCHERCDHEGRPAGRLRLWFVDHAPIAHFAGSLWLNVPEKMRWNIVGKLYELRPDLCWCEFVDCAYLDIKRDDFGCGCEVAVPWQVGRPRYGFCYCQPQAERPAGDR